MHGVPLEGTRENAVRSLLRFCAQAKKGEEMGERRESGLDVVCRLTEPPAELQPPAFIPA